MDLSAARRGVALAWAGWSTVTLGMGVAVGGGFTMIGLVGPHLEDDRGQPMPEALAWIFGGCGVGALALFGALGLGGIAIAVGLWRGAGWARVGALVLAVTNLGNMPVGTLIAVATFLVLAQEARPASSRGAS